MPADPGRTRPLLIILALLAIAVLLDRYLICALCPWMASMGGISLMVVFLDIPVALPLIDPLPVAVLFSLFYTMIPTRQTYRLPSGEKGSGLSGIWGGIFILACWMTAGALVYYFAQGFLPRQVRNGIDSFGVLADINTPLQEYSTIHLRGGFVLLVCFILGGRTLLKRIHRAAIGRPVAHPPQEAVPEPAVRNIPPVHEPVVRPAPVPARQEAPVCTTIAVQPPTPVRPRAAAKSVAVVAPQRVRVYVTIEEPSPLR